MKINLNYLLVGVLAICFYMFLIEGFADDTTKCCTVNNEKIEEIKRIYYNGDPENYNRPREGAPTYEPNLETAKGWWRDELARNDNYNCHSIQTEGECSDNNNCAVREKSLDMYTHGGSRMRFYYDYGATQYNKGALLNLCSDSPH